MANLNKEGDGLHVGDLCSVDGVSGQDVQSSCAAFHDLLHPHSILHPRMDKQQEKSQLAKLTPTEV